MEYIVRPGDTLWSIASAHFAAPEQWTVLARDNHLSHPTRLMVGDRLALRDTLLARRSSNEPSPAAPAVCLTDEPQHAASLIPGRAFLFVLADEIDPLREKVVRKVMVNPRMAARVATRLGRPLHLMTDPSIFGLHPTGPEANVTMGRHVMNIKPSPFSSASTHPFGAPRYAGSPFWIDVEAARSAGATFHDADEIVVDLRRIAGQLRRASDISKIEELERLVRADREVLIRGSVPASAVKGSTAMALTRGLQGIQILGFVVTAIELTQAARQSLAARTAAPLAAVGIRQVGGWAMAWSGMKLGGFAGAALGIETGPGALVCGAAGALVGGFAGYMGFDWIADHIDPS
jgi:hypothetical protein